MWSLTSLCDDEREVVTMCSKVNNIILKRLCCAFLDNIMYTKTKAFFNSLIFSLFLSFCVLLENYIILFSLNQCYCFFFSLAIGQWFSLAAVVDSCYSCCYEVFNEFPLGTTAVAVVYVNFASALFSDNSSLLLLLLL